MQCELMQQQQQQQRVIPEAVMGLASCRDRDQNMYSDINVGGKSKCVCEVSRFSSPPSGRRLAGPQTELQLMQLTELHPTL